MTRQGAIDYFLSRKENGERIMCNQCQNAEDLAIKALQSFPEWVNVKDRLPANCENTLVAHSQGVTIAWFDGFRWTHGAASKHRTIKTVSHWMPLPEPPEEEA